MGQYTKNLSDQPIQADFVYAASAGLIAGCQIVFAVGHVAGVASGAVNIDICEQGTLYPFLSSAQQLKVSSASANDTLAGTGAQVVQIMGLDANYNQIQENVNMSGVTAVNTVNSYLRVNGFSVIQAGSGKINAGDITLQLVAGGSPQGIIRALIGTSQQAVYTIPNGFVGVLIANQFSMAGTPATNFGQAALSANVVSTAAGIPVANSAYVIGARADINSGFPYNEAVLIGYPNPPKTDITARLISSGQASTEVSGGFQIALFSANYISNK